MKAVLVMGATTPLGEHFIRLLLEHQPDARVLAVGAERGSELASLDPSRCDYRSADLTHSREIQALLFGPAARLGTEVVVHLAFHRGAAVSGARAHRLNVESVREVLSLLETHPTIKRLIYCSSSEVYHVTSGQTVLMPEDHPMELSPSAAQRVRDRVEADLTACARMGLAPFSICILRFAEILAPDCGSQLYDYLQSAITFRPLGFDPMINLLTLEDAALALYLALNSRGNGIFNIPGADTLPLARAIRKWGRLGIPVPGPLIAPLYQLRASSQGMEFRYDMNYRRFHFSAVLDGTRARKILKFTPRRPISWPKDGLLAMTGRP